MSLCVRRNLSAYKTTFPNNQASKNVLSFHDLDLIYSRECKNWDACLSELAELGGSNFTIDLIRKRAEHNEGEISTLEELSLHQEGIEKIEHLQNWCRELQILYLQSNIIARIENLGKLKKLVYLNLALNNIEKLENLEGCESLEKLDLTLNFVGDLRDVTSLQNNLNLKHLFLTGNPCTDFDGYRQFVSTVLPLLKTLDGIDITRSERIIASQSFPNCKDQVIQQYNEYKRRREIEKSDELVRNSNVSLPDLDNEEQLKEYWSRKTKNTPETRVQLAKDALSIREGKKKADSETKCYKPRRLFTADGRPLNVNEARVEFKLTEEYKKGCIVLDIAVFRYLDTSYLDVDVQPEYVRVLVKGKVFQIVLGHEVLTEKSTAQRSSTTGHLVITMPLLEPTEFTKLCVKEAENKKDDIKKNDTACYMMNKISRREMLEIGRSDDMDFSRIVENNEKMKKSQRKPKENRNLQTQICQEKLPSDDFVDDPSVPPLE